METWLRCTLFPGQFSSELVAVVQSVHGREFSLFAPKADLDYNDAPDPSAPVPGWVRVDVVQEQNGLLLVRLPQTTLENGQYVTVASGQLRRIPQKQGA